MSLSPDQLQDDRRVQRVALYALLVNLVLAVIRGWLAFLSGSLAVVAVTIDAAIDVAAALLLWGGLKISMRKTKTFPYGLYKLENVIQVIVAILIFVAGAEILREAVLGGHSEVEASALAIWGMALSTVPILALGLYMAREGRRSASPGLLAEARHRWVDLVVSVVALLALLSARLGVPLDRPAAGVVAAFIIYSGWGLLWDGMKVLLDASLDQPTLAQVRKIAQSDPSVVKVRELEGRSSGRYRFLELVLVVAASNLEKAHAISTRVEDRIRKEVPRIDRVIIHCEPQAHADTKLRVAVPLTDSAGTLSSHFGEAPYFAWLVLATKTGELLKQETRTNPIDQAEKAKGILVAEWLIGEKVDLVVQNEPLGKGPDYVFRDAGVRVEVWDVATLDEVVPRLRTEIAPLNP